jgi:hypothetical protein
MRFLGYLLLLAPLVCLLTPNACQAAPGHNIAVFGDSLADGVWAGLYDELKSNPADALYRDSEVGTGLTRPDYEDFVNGFAASLDLDHVTDAVIMFGANDDEGLRDDNHKGYAFGSAGWVTAYQARMDMIISACQKHNIRVIWLGLPVMRAPDRNKDAVFLNSVLQQEAQTSGATFLPLEDSFKGTDGAFALYLPDSSKKLRQVRAPDGTHFTRYGYDLIAAQVIALIEAPPASPTPAQNQSAKIAQTGAAAVPTATPGPAPAAPVKPASAAPAVAHTQ